MNTRAQSLMEYAVLTACIMAALMGMQYYLKRSIEGRIKQTSDQIGDPYDANDTNVVTVTTTTSTMTSTAQPVNITASTGMNDPYGRPLWGYETTLNQRFTVDTTKNETINKAIFGE
jgi:hypothetical protein